MGISADFYIKNNNKLEWLGRINSYGHPDNIPQKLIKSKNKNEFRKEANELLKDDPCAWLPEGGFFLWPLSHTDDNSANFTYVFERDSVLTTTYEASRTIVIVK